MIVLLRLLLRLVLFVAIIYLAYRILRFVFGEQTPDFKCVDCRHCQTLFKDGVTCRYGDKRTFKNPIHIENCTDYEKET